MEIIEAGFAASHSKGDFEAVQAVAAAVNAPVVCFDAARCRAIEAAAQGINNAKRKAHTCRNRDERSAHEI